MQRNFANERNEIGNFINKRAFKKGGTNSSTFIK